MQTALPSITPTISLWRNWPSLLPHAGQIQSLSKDGELALLPPSQLHRFASTVILTCYAPRLQAMWPTGAAPLLADILELYLFVHPAKPCPPTVKGVVDALEIDEACDTTEDAVMLIPLLVDRLLSDAAISRDTPMLRGLLAECDNWVWKGPLMEALGEGPTDNAALNVFSLLPSWEARSPRGTPPQMPLSPETARHKLEELRDFLHDGKHEERVNQSIYAEKVAQMFDPPEHPDTPQLVLAEAGTGVGKTLGYLAPSLAWTEKTGGQVWVSTYTKALQRQVEAELRRLPPSADPNRPRYAVRKGRENYLCLLNLDDLTKRLATTRSPRDAVLTALMVRWVLATRDGDLTGNDFPSWLSGLFGQGAITSLADRRGECIYAGCPHFSKCFVERSVKQGEAADIVVSNHALTLLQASSIAQGQKTLPARLVLDEGHHIFTAADTIFSVALSGQTAQDLRRWLLGPEDGSRAARSRMRGLKRRLEDICASDTDSDAALLAIIQHARILPGPGWLHRIQQGEGVGAFEMFLAQLLQCVQTRTADKEVFYSVEITPYPLPQNVVAQIPELLQALQSLRAAMQRLAMRCLERLNQDDGELEADVRNRLEAAAASLQARANAVVGGWCDLLMSFAEQQESDKQVDWLGVLRDDGALYDVGAFRNWIDPTEAMGTVLRPQILGMTMTSATLKDQGVSSNEPSVQWFAAKQQTGTPHLNPDPHLVALPSPFDYPAQTRVILLNDVPKDDIAAIAGAYRALFLASGGGGLGVFTSIQRLKGVHQRLLQPLGEAGLNLYAQHVDPIDTGTLVDIFRHDRHACLLGTDALRDGIDVPGDSLRLLIFDKIPWPRPTLVHQARRLHFGGRGYDDRLTRYRLKQAYGRLVRRQGDKGVFVLLDSALPSKLYNAFPQGVEIRRCGLMDAAATIREFLA
jgi:ATP-dependent DNA helicase DinG